MKPGIVSPDQLRLALKQLDSSSWKLFEDFVNAFLSGEFHNIRPYGGMHDEGRDGLLFEIEGEPYTFIQSSVTEDFIRKIDEAVTILRKNNHDVRLLIYGSSLEIQTNCDDLRRKLRKAGVVLDVRDRSYFVAHANTSEAQRAASHILIQKLVAPELGQAVVIESARTALSKEDESVALAYLEVTVGTDDAGKNLNRLCLESLIKYALRDSDPPSKIITRPELYERIFSLVTAEDRGSLRQRIDASLMKMTKRVLKYHKAVDSFALEFSHREHLRIRFEEQATRIEKVSSLALKFVQAIITEQQIDYPVDEHLLAQDVKIVCEHVLFYQGIQAAKSIGSNDTFSEPLSSLSVFTSKLHGKNDSPILSSKDLSLGQVLDIVPFAAERLLSTRDKQACEYFRLVRDSYFLLFALRETPDIQGALNNLLSDMKLLVDASIIVPCMCERIIPDDRQHSMTSLLAASTALGIKLVISDECLDELLATIRTAAVVYRNYCTYNAAYEHSELAKAYIQAPDSESKPSTFEDFTGMFVGENLPKEDIMDYLGAELKIQYNSFSEQRNRMEQPKLEELITLWKSIRAIRPHTNQEHFDSLVRHDAKSLMLIDILRAEEPAVPGKGYSWWWLTRDNTAFRIDETTRQQPGRKGRSTMRAEFLLRHISVTNRGQQRKDLLDKLPTVVEASALGFIPSELQEEAEQALLDARNVKPYLRTRRLRDLLIRAKTNTH